MTDARLSSLWHRAGPVAALAAIAALGMTQGCGGSSSGTGGSTTTTGGGTTTTTGTTTTGTGGTGGTTTSSSTSSTGGTGGTSGTMVSLDVGANVHDALDATPDPDGVELYFTGVDPVKGPGVFKAPADGSAPTAVEVKAGPPFVAPFGIAISTDGKQLYVADPGADDGGGADRGVIFSLPVGGGTPTALSGTNTFNPRSLEIVKENNADVLYFTGFDPTDNQAGVFKISASGGTATVVAKGAPFRDPSGIAIAADGTIYVADTVAAATRLASIIVIKNGAASEFVSGIAVGYPCGIALTKDDTTLLVSALDLDKKTDVLLQIEVATKAQTPFSTGIDKFTDSSGLHRAKNTNVFAWADLSAGTGGGTVFRISFK